MQLIINNIADYPNRFLVGSIGYK